MGYSSRDAHASGERTPRRVRKRRNGTRKSNPTDIHSTMAKRCIPPGRRGVQLATMFQRHHPTPEAVVSTASEKYPMASRANADRGKTARPASGRSRRTASARVQERYRAKTHPMQAGSSARPMLIRASLKMYGPLLSPAESRATLLPRTTPNRKEEAKKASAVLAPRTFTAWSTSGRVRRDDERKSRSFME